MILTKINIKLLIVLIYTISTLTLNAEVKFSAKLDSSSLLMGNQTLIHLEIQQDATQRGQIINEPYDSSDVVEITKGVEFGGVVRNDTISIDAGRKQINRDYVIQSFDSGVYTIPPFKYVVGVDTFESKQLTLTVVPVKLDSADLSTDTIKTFAKIEEIELSLSDRIPDSVKKYWYLWLIFFIIVIVLIVLLYKYKSEAKTMFVKKKILPPYELAKHKLNVLKSKGLCVEGYEKDYYTTLTDILREYLVGRYKIYAQEMTSSQIIDAIKNNSETSHVNIDLATVLQTADFVKFAKVLPSAEENIKSYQIVVDFVEATKPITETDNSSNNSTQSRSKNSNNK